MRALALALLAGCAAPGETDVWPAHEGWVAAVAFSPDGALLVSAGDDRVLRLRDARSGRELWSRSGDAVRSLAFRPDGARLAAGGWGGALRILDVRDGRELLRLQGHAETVGALAFSPDGLRLASGSDDDTLRLWDAANGDELLLLDQGNEYDVTALAFSPDGRLLASGDGESTLRLWDPDSGEQLLALKGHEATLSGVAFSPDGRRLLTGSQDGTLKLWDARSARELATFRGHAEDVSSVAFSPDGRRIASGSADDSVRLWDAESGTTLAVLRGAEDVTCIAFSPDGRRLAAGSRGVVRIWTPPPQEAPISGVHHAREVEGSPVHTAAGMAWWKGRLILADRVSKELRTFTPPDRFGVFKTLTHPVGAAVDPEGRLVVTEKEKDVLHRVARITEDGAEETLVSGSAAGSPHFLAIHPDGAIYWSGFPDGGTRCLLPGAKEVVVASPRIVHTYGIGLSPGRDWLYVSSKIPNPDRRGVWRFPVGPDGRLGEGEFFIQVEKFTTGHLKDLPPAKDGSTSLKGWLGRLQGLAVDRLGYIYVGGAESHHSGSAVAVFTPDGKTLAAMILGVPRDISGLAFGGEDGRTLFITGAGEHRLYQARLPVPGVR